MPLLETPPPEGMPGAPRPLGVAEADIAGDRAVVHRQRAGVVHAAASAFTRDAPAGDRQAVERRRRAGGHLHHPTIPRRVERDRPAAIDRHRAHRVGDHERAVVGCQVDRARQAGGERDALVPGQGGGVVQRLAEAGLVVVRVDRVGERGDDEALRLGRRRGLGDLDGSDVGRRALHPRVAHLVGGRHAQQEDTGVDRRAAGQRGHGEGRTPVVPERPEHRVVDVDEVVGRVEADGPRADQVAAADDRRHAAEVIRRRGGAGVGRDDRVEQLGPREPGEDPAAGAGPGAGRLGGVAGDGGEGQDERGEVVVEPAAVAAGRIAVHRAVGQRRRAEFGEQSAARPVGGVATDRAGRQRYRPAARDSAAVAAGRVAADRAGRHRRRPVAHESAAVAGGRVAVHRAVGQRRRAEFGEQSAARPVGGVAADRAARQRRRPLARESATGVAGRVAADRATLQGQRAGEDVVDIDAAAIVGRGVAAHRATRQGQRARVVDPAAVVGAAAGDRQAVEGRRRPGVDIQHLAGPPGVDRRDAAGWPGSSGSPSCRPARAGPAPARPGPDRSLANVIVWSPEVDAASAIAWRRLVTPAVAVEGSDSVLTTIVDSIVRGSIISRAGRRASRRVGGDRAGEAIDFGRWGHFSSWEIPQWAWRCDPPGSAGEKGGDVGGGGVGTRLVVLGPAAYRFGPGHVPGRPRSWCLVLRE